MATFASGATLFEDGFESVQLGSLWSISATSDGRVAITTAHGPASGQSHLVLDDAVNDAIYSVSEATLAVDVTDRKNIVLSFKAKSLGNEPHPPGGYMPTRMFDGVTVSIDGGQTWHNFQSLAELSTEWRSFSVVIGGGVKNWGEGVGPKFRIRFSAYDNSPAPLDGIAIDDVVVTGDEDQRSLVELPSPLIEGTGPQTGYVQLAFPASTALTLALNATSPNQVSLPPSVTIPAGATHVAFDFSVLDNNVADLTRTFGVYASAPEVSYYPASLTIYDDEAPIPTLSVPPQLTEGESPTTNATVSLSHAAAVPLTLTVSAAPPGELTLPPTVTIPAGQTQAVFTVRATDDNRIDGTVPVTLYASAPGFQTASATTATIDNETRALSLDFPAAVQEGTTVSGTVTISGTLPTPVTVQLTSGTPGEVALPASVSIAAGATAVVFQLTATENTARDGTRAVLIDASADTFNTTSRPVTVRDNEVAGYRFGTLPDIANTSAALPVVLSARDVEGNTINGFAGNVNLALVAPDGTTQPVTPATVSLPGSKDATANIMLPAGTTVPGSRLRASDANGNTGESHVFDVLRTLSLAANDLVWDAARGRIYASVGSNAAAPYANSVVAIDPGTLQVVGSVSTGNNPRRLVLTPGGEALYAALDGNGTVARIDPVTLTVISSFAVGVDQSHGTLYAGDLCPIAGAPNTLAVTQYGKNSSPGFVGVAVYENGIMRPTRTNAFGPSNILQPSADPTVIFGFNTVNSENGLRRLQIDASGVKELAVNQTLASAQDIKSEGDMVYASGGAVIDGLKMERIGNFGVAGVITPDGALKRAYALEKSGFYEPATRVSAFDTTSFAAIYRLSLSSAMPVGGSFMRVGTNGLAFRSGTSIALINSDRLVPPAAPTDLSIAMQTDAVNPNVGAVVTYSLDVTNRGANLARQPNVSVTLSDGQIISNVSATAGVPVVNSATVSLPLADMEPGASVSITIQSKVTLSGGIYATARATAQSVDSDFSNNAAAKFVMTGYNPAVDLVNHVRLPGNNLIVDPTRNRIWTTIPGTVELPLGKSVVAIDPSSGAVSDPIPLNGEPRAGAIGLSSNGRYLYVGLSDVAAVQRYDLSAKPVTSVRISLGSNQWNNAAYARDIEALQGDGTSFMVTTYGDDGAAVYDGAVRRATRSGIYTINMIEPTPDPTRFFGFPGSQLTVSASGVTISRTVSNLLGGGQSMRSGGKYVLSDSGYLADSTTLTLVSNLGKTGAPCVDVTNDRAYLLNLDGTLHGFDLKTTLATGTFSFPQVASVGSQVLARFGLDGFAILTNNSKIYFSRVSTAIPALRDLDGDGIADRWEANYFGTLDADGTADQDRDGVADALEYLLGTSPLASNPAGIELSATPTLLRLIFTRRAGVAADAYVYEVSTDLQQWDAVAPSAQTVLSTTSLEGVEMQKVMIMLPSPSPSRAFARIRWTRD